ncbi:MAG: hypothetical protein GX121_06005 [Ignavibacteria bacterium]|nr:hypothetical protein [Ignavibacteria bacterium]
MEIKYENNKVEKYFNDFALMSKDKGVHLAKSAKKHYNLLKASENFYSYISYNYGKPHLLSGNLKGYYGVRLSANIRLIIKPEAVSLQDQALKNCKTVIIKGVMDYHGKKIEWIIP